MNSLILDFSSLLYMKIYHLKLIKKKNEKFLPVIIYWIY